MRLGLDVHMLAERHTGVAVYVSELLSGLLRQLGDQPDLVIELFGKSADEEHIRRRYGIDHPRVRWTAIGGRRFWTSVYFPLYCVLHRRALRRRLDVVLFPAHQVPPGLPVPALVTIHDLAFEMFPAAFRRRDLFRLRAITRAGVRRARCVLADSECTARDVTAIYGVPPERIRVALLGAGAASASAAPDAASAAAVRAQYAIRAPYVLAVGTLQPRKNYPRLMQAVARVRERGIDVQLVIAGADGWMADTVHAARAAFADPSFIVLTGYAGDADIAALYHGAAVAAQVGLYEGFGLPVLEAFAAGVPSMVARAGALPEVAGDAAVLVDPERVDAMADALAQLLGDAPLRAALRARMPEQRAKFSWARTVDRTLAAAAEVVAR